MTDEHKSRAGPATVGGGNDGSRKRDEFVDRLLQLADQGPEIPSDGAARIKSAIRPQWQEQVRARATRRVVWIGGGLAAAASLVAALILGLWLHSATPVARGVVASYEMIRGSVEMVPPTGTERLITGTDLGAEVDAGSWIRTGDNGRAALRLRGGQSLRLDVGTRLRLESAEVVVLDRGAVYVDSDFAEGTGIAVQTALGVARDIGTRFEVRSDDDGLIVRVRGGIVSLTHADDQLEVVHGTQLTVEAEGSVTTSRVSAHGPEWNWVQQVAPPFEIEGRTVIAFLDWVSGETGLWIRFAEPELERFAGETLLHGAVQELVPSDATDVVLASCGLVADRDGAALVVKRVSE
jgi:ferric-dicitrate binding protein FerR (iron transport regulator)